MSNETPIESARQLLQAKIDEIEAFELPELRRWVTARLEGKDPILGDMAGNSRAYPLVAIYPRFKRSVREDLEKVSLELLNEFVAGKGLIGEAADDLLILGQRLFPERSADRLRFLAEMPLLFDRLPSSLRARVLQTLVALREKMDVSFWTSCFQKYGGEIAAICFEGIWMNSVEDALEFLTRLAADGSVLDAIALHIPAFLDQILKYEQEEIFASAFRRLRDRIPSDLREEISDWCREMNVPQSPQSTRGWLGDDFDIRILSLGFDKGRDRSQYVMAETACL